MRNLTREFENKSIDYEKLLQYGFLKREDRFCYEKNIHDGQFIVFIEISEDKQISKVMDLASNEEYVLVDVANSTGEFVGKVREEYERVLNDIIKNCTTGNVFKDQQSEFIINYVKEKYEDDLEYLWEKFPDNAIWRNKKNSKWYGALLVIPESKLGIESDKIVTVIDLRYQKEHIKNIVDNHKVFPGYHMNKSSWITIKLDESCELEEIYKLIDNSYELSLKK